MGLSVPSFAQVAILQIDSNSAAYLKYDTIKPKKQVLVYYSLINVAKADSDSLTKGLKIYTYLRINNQKVTSRSKGKVLDRNLRIRSLHNEKAIIYDTIILNDSISPPAAGTNVIVIWPTGNGVHSTTMNISHFFLITYTGIEALANPENPVKIYPNPARDLIHFEIQNQDLKLEKVILRNIVGQVILEENLRTSELNISSCPPGCYILQLQYSNGSIGTYKLVRN